MKIFIAAMGPGEIGQGVAFARYALKKGAHVIFAVSDSNNMPMVNINDNRFKVLLSENSKSLNRDVLRHKPDVFLLCNSKMFSSDGFYPSHPPLPKLPTLSIDSNWLFGPDSPYKSLPWVDVYCINIPKKVFRLGLKKYGGHYSIPAETLKKIKVVGLLPSYPKISASARRKTRDKYGVSREEKLIFLYASTASLSSPTKIDIFQKAIDAVRILRKKGHGIKIINVGRLPRDFGIKEKWFLNVDNKDTAEFYGILASSDLVFQHQGLGTLEQAIAAGVPAIANVRNLKDEESPYHAHAWEVMPFVRSGACSMLYFSDPLAEAVKEIEKLLYNSKAISDMMKGQSRLQANGEKNVFMEMERLAGDFKEKKKVV